MNRKIISEALNGIQEEYIIECESYAPNARKLSSGKESYMERNRNIALLNRRKIVTLILAACLIMGLGITAYASGLFQSLIARWANSYVIEAPTQDLVEQNPDYAVWLDEQLETRTMMEEIGEKAEICGETVSVDSIDSTITLLESYYDGERISMACRFKAPGYPANYGFDESHPMFDNLRVAGDIHTSEQFVIWNAPTMEDYIRADKQYRENGKVGFITYDIFVRDSVIVNGEDYGPCHSAVDEEGYFVVTPFINGLGDVVLSDNCRNQPTVDVTVTIRKVAVFHWYEAGKYSYCTGEIEDFPVKFTINNQNQS